jgi:type I restriction enzyme S subunit
MSDFHSIGSFAKVRRGSSPRPINNPDFFGGTVGWVRISDVTQRNNKYLKQTQQYLSPLGESCSLRVDAGDLIMSICATVGKPMIVDIPACIHDGFVQIYDINNADVEYLYYLLQFHEKDFEKRGQPGTQVNLNTTIVENEVVFLPRFEQQQKIAKILSTVDNLIEKTQVLIDKYTAVKQGLMTDLFTRGIDLTPGDNYGQLRPSVAEAPELYQKTVLGWVPKCWEVLPSEDLCDRICVGIVIQPTQYYVEYGVPTFRSANVREGGIEPNNFVYISTESNALLAKSQIKAGDVLSVRTGYPGTSAVVPKEFSGSNCIDILISSPNKRVLSEYLCEWINSEFGKGQVLRMQGGIAQQHFNVGDMKMLLVALPSKTEQIKIIAALDSVKNKIKTEEAIVDKYQVMKKGLMQDLLTGKVRVYE